MQTSSKPRSGPSEAPQKTSPATPKSTRVTKTGGAESDSSTSKLIPTKSPADKSPKVTERRSPRSPATEKKRPSRVSELESQLTQLHGDLKKTKDQQSSSESWKRRAQLEAEEAKKQLQAMSLKLEDSQRQLMEFSAAEESRLQELRQISQDRDQAWESEIEAIRKQQLVDSQALTSAMNEIHSLNLQLEMVKKSEAIEAKQSEIAENELQALKQDMAETLTTVRNLKVQLKDSEKAEADAEAMVIETQQQLEVAKAVVETLRSDGSKLMETCKATASELEESRARVNSLEQTVKELQANQVTVSCSGTLKLEQSRSSLEAAEIKYREEQIQSTMQIQSAYEMAERFRTESELRESELNLALRSAEEELVQLKADLLDKETELQCISDMNCELKAKLGNGQVNQLEVDLESKLMESIAEVTDLKAHLMDKETELQSISEENELLKLELGKKEVQTKESSEAAMAEAELAKAKEKEALMRLGYITEEADKSSRTAARVAEKLEAAQAMNSEMEAELRRLRVQSDQWRKAAEAAAAVLTTGNNGRFVERTGSLDTQYQSVAGKLISSPFSDDLNFESPKRKNNNVLRRIGGMWKKSPK